MNTIKKYSFYEDPDLWPLITQTAHLLKKVGETALKELELSFAQLGVLHAIDSIDREVTPGEVARWLHLTPHSTSEMVARMEKNGLVKKANDKLKKGRKIITLTPKGRKLFMQAKEIESIQNILSCLSDEQRSQISSCLGLVRKKALQKLGEEASFNI